MYRDAPDDDDDHNDEEGDISSLIVSGSICAIAADPKFSRGETVWFVFVNEVGVSSSDDCMDNNGHGIPKGYPYLKCHYLEYVTDNTKGRIYTKGESTAFISKESIIHPFVIMNPIKYRPNKEYFHLTNEFYVEVLRYVQHSAQAVVKF